MLAIFEKYIKRLRSSHSDEDLTKILYDMAELFGFRSAYIIEYASKSTGPEHVLDTVSTRRTWWAGYFASDLRPAPREIKRFLKAGPLLKFNGKRFGEGSQKLQEACEEHDVVDVVTIPISHEGELVGLAGFCGTPTLDRQRETALQLCAYAVFAQSRVLRNSSRLDVDSALTIREKEVMTLAAKGLTSIEIGEQLGMSTRTANQHFDNVAGKLHTRNRTHTVADVIRQGFLD
jgi:DNA-binding CsgD family transcriptional regulator